MPTPSSWKTKTTDRVRRDGGRRSDERRRATGAPSSFPAIDVPSWGRGDRGMGVPRRCRGASAECRRGTSKQRAEAGDDAAHFRAIGIARRRFARRRRATRSLPMRRRVMSMPRARRGVRRRRRIISARSPVRAPRATVRAIASPPLHAIPGDFRGLLRRRILRATTRRKNHLDIHASKRFSRLLRRFAGGDDVANAVSIRRALQVLVVHRKHVDSQVRQEYFPRR